MLRNTKDLEAFTLGANDGAIGKITDCYFDDERWVIRYLIVETGPWLSSRKVLISPAAIGKRAWWGERTLPIDLTRAQIESSPGRMQKVRRPSRAQHAGRRRGPGRVESDRGDVVE